MIVDKDKLQAEKINAALSSYLMIAVANAIASLLLYFSLTSNAASNIPLMDSWLINQLSFSGLMLFIHARYAQNFESIQAIWDWYIDMPVNIWGGLGWGMSWALFIDPNNLLTALFLNTAICCVVLGIVVSNPLDQRAMLATLSPCLLPVIIKAFWLGGNLFNWIAVIAVAILGIAYVFSHILGNLYLSMLKERELSKQLVVKLEEEKAKIEKINQEKTRFLAAASHDLRQPTQAIRLYEGLLSASIEDKQQQALLQKISIANDSLTGLLESLLDMSKLDSGTVMTKPETILLNELFDHVYEQYADKASAQAIQLSYRANHRVTLYIDPFHLQRILNNLIENAIRHMGRPGKILLGVRCFADEVRIEVHDTGIGIPEEQQENVFNEFYQVNNEQRNKSKGLGLGLSIVKRLAEMNDCTIDLVSRPGRGCCFRLHIPHKQIDNDASHSITHPDPQTGIGSIEDNNAIPESLKNKQILVLDDGLLVLAARHLLAAVAVAKAHVEVEAGPLLPLVPWEFLPAGGQLQGPPDGV